MADTPLISLIDVTREYRDGRVTALRRVTLTLARGEYVAITGPSGCGKSTLLHVLCGIEVPTGGTVLFEGRSTPRHDDWIRLRARCVGLVFQASNLLPTLTAVQNVEIPMFGLVRSRTEREARARRLIARVGLTDRATHRPAEMSGGQQQRVAVARALANAPTLILADEPTGNLDSASALDILELLESWRREASATLIVATHDNTVAARADRLITMRDGVITADGRR